MIDTILLEKYPRMKGMFGYLESEYSLYAKMRSYLFAHFDETYLKFGEGVLDTLAKKYRDPERYRKAMSALIRLSNEYLVLQARLHRTDKYQSDSFSEVNKNIYQNKTMKEYYLDGLLMSQVAWANHYKIINYFIEHAGLTDGRARVLDVPCGTGIYSHLVRKHYRHSELHSYDISPYSCDYTKEYMRHAGDDLSGVAVDQCDVFTLPKQRQYNYIVCVELLEHLNNPDVLLEKLAALLDDAGKVFLSTAIYTAAVDHIYLFRNIGEVRTMLEKLFVIDSEIILPLTLEDYKEDMERVPINYACVLSKR